MDKNSSFESFEYLQTANPNSEAEFLVVQEDATFLINRGVQYVTQLEDVKTDLESQPCAVYSVSQQQLYIGVDNPTELITGSDELIMQNGGSNLFTSSYLMQPPSAAPVASIEQVQENIAEKTEVPDTTLVEMETQQSVNEEADSKANTLFTEVTLTDEQCQMLEQKGWIMLKSNDRVFILDTLGLHDITNNEKLIQKLIYEIPSNEVEDKDVKSTELDNLRTTENILLNAIESKSDESSEGEILIEFESNGVPQTPELHDLPFVVQLTQETKPSLHNKSEQSLKTVQVSEFLPKNDTEKKLCKTGGYVDGSMVKINTKQCFKEVPDKIVLGKTKSGKLLVAKLKRISSDLIDCQKLEPDPKPQSFSEDDVSADEGKNMSSEDVNTDNILDTVLKTDKTSCTQADVDIARNLILGLLEAPSLKTSLLQNKLALTRVQENHDTAGNLISETDPTLVTGKIVQSKNMLKFQHEPSIIEELIGTENMDGAEDTENQILHIHVTEDISYDTKNEKKVTNCITLNERVTPIIKLSIKTTETTNTTFNKIKTADGSPDVLQAYQRIKSKNEAKRSLETLTKQSGNEVTTPKVQRVQPKKSNVSYACGICASIFYTQSEFDEHQKTECEEPVKDTQKIDLGWITLETEKGEMYACSFCMAKFNKLGNCQKHLSIHKNPNSKIKKNPDGEETTVVQTEKNKRDTFDCKMCSLVFHHPSTLTKHIVAVHIKTSEL